MDHPWSTYWCWFLSMQFKYHDSQSETDDLFSVSDRYHFNWPLWKTYLSCIWERMLQLQVNFPVRKCGNHDVVNLRRSSSKMYACSVTVVYVFKELSVSGRGSPTKWLRLDELHCSQQSHCLWVFCLWSLPATIFTEYTYVRRRHFFNPFTPKTFPFFALIDNRLGGTYVKLQSSTLA